MQPWVATFMPIKREQLKHTLASAFAQMVGEGGDSAFELIEVRQRDNLEMVVVKLRTERPQRPVIAINHEEDLAIVFASEEHAPIVFVLREDFPDTPHQARMPVGFPFCICVDDRPWAEAKTGYSPVELGRRVLSWFRKACRGELRDPAQPFEPFFAVHDPFELIMPRAAWSGITGAEFRGVITDDRRDRIITLVSAGNVSQPKLLVIAYDLSAETMSRMRQAPVTLGQLAVELQRRGVDLVADLKARLAAWYADDSLRDGNFRAHPCFLLRLPLINPLNGQVEGVDTVGFISNSTVGDLGVALGLFYHEEGSGVASVGYQPRIPAANSEIDKVEILGCLIHGEFDTRLARVISGRETIATGRVLMIGGGAIGSSVAESLVREGAFDAWSVLDDDTFLPHNEARHTLSSEDVARPKAGGVARRLKRIRPDTEVIAVDENFLGPLSMPAEDLLAQAHVTIDASASVAVGRKLSDIATGGRRASIFFNPTGTSGVLLLEDAERTIDLRSLEALYHRAIQVDPRLEGHLAESATIRYTGACRMLTSRIPASRIQVLSGLIADGLGTALTKAPAMVRIWTLADDGGVSVSSPELSVTVSDLQGWAVGLASSLEADLRARRARQLPNETGGALLGIVDVEAKRIELVAVTGAPPDSQEALTEFVRGTLGLKDEVEGMIKRSGYQIRYVGEWHSHPRGSSTMPSGTDLEQLVWLTSTLSADGVPAVMYIVGDDDARPLIGMAADGDER